MAFQTGSANDPAALRSAIISFATTNGWTDTSGVLSKGLSNVRLMANGAEEMTVDGADDAAFTSNVCGQAAKIYVTSTLWPVDYRLFSLGSPDFIACVIQYAVDRVQQVWFGDVTKYGTWTGGQWFGATHGDVINTENQITITPTAAGSIGVGSRTSGGSPAAPFWGTENRNPFSGAVQDRRNSFVRADIDGFIWPGSVTNTDRYPNVVRAFDVTVGGNDLTSIHTRQPNQWNNQSALLPIYLHLLRSDGFYSPIGHVAHMRMMKVANHNIGDIITLGADQWMTFPWYRRDLDNPDTAEDTTGTWGCAISYVP